jgi:GNAT superfamily N-acetyltransferase
MVDPEWRGRGIGGRLYEARRELTMRLGLRRIRAGARLRGYHRVADTMTAVEYVRRVERGELRDPTLSFQRAWLSGTHGRTRVSAARS